MSYELSDYIYDWNGSFDIDSVNNPIQIHDETLRDGLQSTAITIPTVAQRFEIILQMEQLGVDSVDLGFPGAGNIIEADVTALAAMMAQHKLRISPTCAGRTLEKDVTAIVNISQATGTTVEAMLFVGSSPVRKLVEKWDISNLSLQVKNSIRLAIENNLQVTFVTEDTTRSHPSDLEELFKTAIDCGARRICVCDTVGHALPESTYRLIQFVKDLVGSSPVGIDFHGHMDRGLGLWNSIMALKAGANRIHATALGIGERSGNTSMEELLTNLKLLGWISNDLTGLVKYSNLVSKYFNYPIPKLSPIVGSTAFETSSGIHTAAILKAQVMKSDGIINGIYSGVPASWFNRRQNIRIGPMSGKSSVKCWSEARQVFLNESVIDRVLVFAKQSDKILEDFEIFNILNQEGLDEKKPSPNS